MNDFTILLILKERVQIAQWSLDNCVLKESSLAPQPVLEEVIPPPTQMPPTNLQILEKVFKVFIIRNLNLVRNIKRSKF